MPDVPVYLQLAQRLEEQIRAGVLRVGERLPSIREMRRQQGVSISTVLQAYLWLENRGCIEPRPQSGFYVRVPYAELLPEPEAATPPAKPPTEVTVGDVMAEVVRTAADPKCVPLGAACPSPALLPNRKLATVIQSITRRMPAHSSQYGPLAGCEELRRQIARRSLESGCTFSPADLVITVGAMEALNLALRAVASPGDIIAVESPTYFGILQAVESLGMRAVEIPTNPRDGVDVAALERAIRRHRLRAMVLMPTCHNPLGSIMPDAAKKELVELTARHNVAVIEDDVYGDLYFTGPRPRPLKSYDRKGLVLLCSSFSKTLAPGFRLGWLHPGRFRAAVERTKAVNTIATAMLPQLATARFLETGNYDRHVRRLRVTFANQVHAFSRAIARYFPEGTRISRPQGGYVLWVELPARVDAMKLYRAARQHNIGISPGPVFSASGAFRNCIRLNCGFPLDEKFDSALLQLGRLAGV